MFDLRRSPRCARCGVHQHGVALNNTGMSIGAGTEIGDKLRLVSPLGQGSAGQVWLARHLRLGSDVAVKFLHRDVSSAPTARERFVREARTIAKIRSPHVVQVHDFGFHDDRAYLVMEYLVGETLEARIERIGTLGLEEIARVCTQIAKALQKAHDAGIVHRDIKPANVFLVDYGDEEIAKVVDFGIVKSVDDAPASSRPDTLTQAGTLLGTPYYMSPEQIQDSGNVDHRADLWALGVIVYECLLGQLPFQAPNFPLLVVSICQDPIRMPSTLASVPPAMDAWVERALQRDREQRFGSARELARELCQALLFSDRSDCLSVPDGILPPDLLWSGAYPTNAANSPQGARSGSSFPPAARSSPPVDICRVTPEPPLPSVVVAGRMVSDRPAAYDSAVLLDGETLQDETACGPSDETQDGSLEAQVSTRTPPVATARSGTIPRAVLFGLGATCLLAIGWFASRYTAGAPKMPPLSAGTAATVAQVPAARTAPLGASHSASTAIPSASPPALSAPITAPSSSSTAAPMALSTAPLRPAALPPSRVHTAHSAEAKTTPEPDVQPDAGRPSDPLETRQ